MKSSTTASLPKVDRLCWLDNLRTFMIFLVVVFHSAIIYEKNGMGIHWWIVTEPSESDIPGIVFLLLNIFIMPTIFFIAGYLSPHSIKSKESGEFLKAKFKRLMVPWILAVLTLIPLYKVIFLYANNLPQEHWSSYFHWSNGVWSQNWLWFLPVLFVFESLYLVLVKIGTFKIKISIAQIFYCFLVLAVFYGFFLEYFGLQGWTKTVLIDFQNERLLIYFLIFLFAACSYNYQLFDSISNKKRALLIHFVGWLPVNAYVFFVIFGIIKPYAYLISKVVDSLLTQISFVLALTYLIFSMITLFRKYCNKNNWIATELNRNSYSVYIIHVIILGVLGTLLLNVTIPILVKFLITIMGTFIASNIIVSLYKRAAYE